MGTEERDKAGTGFVPLTADTWLTLQNSARVSSALSRSLYEQGVLFAALAEFHQLALGAEQINRLLLVADEANEQTARTINRASTKNAPGKVCLASWDQPILLRVKMAQRFSPR